MVFEKRRKSKKKKETARKTQMIYASISNVSVFNHFVKKDFIFDNNLILIMKEITQMKKYVKLIATVMQSYSQSMNSYGEAILKVKGN